MVKKTINKAIVFDMDGTIADLYNVQDWLEQLEAEKTKPYIDAKPIYNMCELNNTLDTLKKAGWAIIVVSWSSKNATTEYTKRVKKAKKQWLDNYEFPYDRIHVVKYGTVKHNCCKYLNYGILIDDNKDVRNSWKKGKSIEPDKGLIKKLKKLA